VINPSDETVLTELPDVVPADVDNAIAAAGRALDEGPWPRLAIAERVTALRRRPRHVLTHRCWA